MKKFFIKGSLFIITFFLVSFILQEILIFGIRAIDVGEYGVMNNIIEGKINADIIISGSSRTWRGINPNVLSKTTNMSCYNISSDGVELEIQIPKFKMYLNYNVPPKILIQNIDPVSCGVSNKIYEPYKYFPYLGDNDFYTGLLKIDPGLWIHKYFAPSNLIFFNFDFYIKFFKEIFYSIKDREILINGYFADNSRWTIDENIIYQRYPNGVYMNISNEYLDYINELESICKENNILLLYVSTPQYYKYMEIVKEKLNIHDHFEQRASKNNIEYLDYSKSKLSKSTQYFYNFSHLNKKGANTFSEILARDINQLLAE